MYIDILYNTTYTCEIQFYIEKSGNESRLLHSLRTTWNYSRRNFSVAQFIGEKSMNHTTDVYISGDDSVLTVDLDLIVFYIIYVYKYPIA